MESKINRICESVPEGGEPQKSTAPSFIKTKIPGYIRHDYQQRPNDKLKSMIPFNMTHKYFPLYDMFKLSKPDKKAFYKAEPTVKIHNAREIQDSMTTADFFKRYGFVLLKHKSEVKDWNTDYGKKI